MAKSDWNEGKPEAGIAAKLLDDRVRVNNSAIEAIINEDHEMVTGGDTDGFHRQVTFGAQVSTPTNAANKGFAYIKDVNSVVELHFLDESGNEVVLTHAGQMGFVDRGDPAAVDYDETLTPLVADNAWHDLDLSADVSVPTGVKAVVLFVVLQDDAVGSVIRFRKNGNANAVNTGLAITAAAGIGDFQDITVACDTSQVIEYKLFTADTLVPTTCTITVKGWFF